MNSNPTFIPVANLPDTCWWACSGCAAVVVDRDSHICPAQEKPAQPDVMHSYRYSTGVEHE